LGDRNLEGVGNQVFNPYAPPTVDVEADVAMIFRADRRTVRDHVAGTRVIRS
jgi:hypothetical protein